MAPKKALTALTTAPSDEQQRIIERVISGKSAIGDAVAGSGKTTTVLWLAKQANHKSILQVTYNRMLKEEVRKKVAQYGLTNLSVENYHSIATNYYAFDASTDAGLQRVLAQNTTPHKIIPEYDIIVLDEVQDMSAVYYGLIRKFITDMSRSTVMPTLLMLGDHNQCVYEFMSADRRFLTRSPDIWPEAQPMPKLALCTSYRITKPMADFVNEVMIGAQRIVAIKDGPPVLYIRSRKRHDMIDYLSKSITSLVNEGVNPGDIFILARSVTKKGVFIPPVIALENALVRRGIPVHVTRTKDTEKHASVINNKVMITTFNQSKGRERPYVFIIGFDASFFINNSDTNPYLCPDLLYVACTRAEKQLVIVQIGDELPFLQCTLEEIRNKPYVDFRVDGKKPDASLIFPDNRIDLSGKPHAHQTSPTDLIMYLSDPVIERISPLVDEITKTIVYPYCSTTLPKISGRLGTPGVQSSVEQVSDLIGVAIPTMYEKKMRGRCTVEESVVDMYTDHFMNNKVMAAHMRALKMPCKTTEDFLYLCNIYSSMNESLHFRLEQLKNYDWLDDEVVKACDKVLDRTISIETNGNYELIKSMQFEEHLGINQDELNTLLQRIADPSVGTVVINAIIDAFSNDTIWEFKCVEEITTEHKLQAILYAALWQLGPCDAHGPRAVKILNIRTGEVVLINHMSERIYEILGILVEAKFAAKPKTNDEDFISRALKIRQERSVKVSVSIDNSTDDYGISDLDDGTLDDIIGDIHKNEIAASTHHTRNRKLVDDNVDTKYKSSQSQRSDVRGSTNGTRSGTRSDTRSDTRINSNSTNFTMSDLDLSEIIAELGI